MSHLKHKLLVASSSMGDTDFTNAVILLLEHDETQGAYGIVINRKGEVPPDSEKQPFPVYVGGPCEMNKRITILHGIRRLSNKKLRIVPGLWYGTPKTLERALTLPLDDHRFKVLTGCAGWRAGQLEKEIAVGAWHVVEATPELVLDGDPDELWQNLCPKHTAPGFGVN